MAISPQNNFNPKKRWRRVQELVRHFLHRWLKKWRPSLPNRKKWLTEERDLRVGDVMLVLLSDSSRGHWPLGRVVEVFQGKNGHFGVA